MRNFRLYLILFLGPVVALLLTTQALAQWSKPLAVLPPDTSNTLTRVMEPVIATNLFSDTIPLEEIFIYRYRDDAWSQIPFQIDEIDANGVYTTNEGNGLDANDEIVFMVDDVGDLATAAIDTALSISETTLLEISDPLEPNASGWVYVVRSSELIQTNTTDYVSFDTDSMLVATSNYTTQWSSLHNGLDLLSISGSGDLLDRTKVSVDYRLLGVPRTLNEDDIPLADLTLLKDGPVRVLVERGQSKTLAYASMFQTVIPIDLTALPDIVTVDTVRVSIDLSTGITGTYYNENLSFGVQIDGEPDSEFSRTPFNQAWRQSSSENGTIIQVIDTDGISGTLSHYYKDDSTLDGTDTGDSRSYGDSGFMVTRPTVEQLTFVSNQYILVGNQANRGEEFYNRFRSPLETRIQTIEPVDSKVYLPVTIQ